MNYSNKVDIMVKTTNSGIRTDIEEKKINSKKFYYFFKRCTDIMGSLCGLIILFPLFLIVSLLIKIEDPKGKVYYKHFRIGKNMRKIPVYKFRSMYQNSQEIMNNFTEEQKKEYAENFKLKNDPRITKIGKIIRKTSIDELPQLVNVLKGEMTIVGPRPIVEAELNKYGEYQNVYLSVKPGLTGMWQAYGRSDTSYEERVKLDVYYVENQKLSLDVKIIFATIISVLSGKGAY